MAFFFSRRSGLTLIEVLVVVVVTALLSTIVLTYTRTGERQLALTIEIQKVANLLLRAKSFAVTTYTGTTPNRCGYGMVIDYVRNTYSLFAYEEPSPPSCSTLSSVPPAFETILYTYPLDSRLSFVNSNPDSLSIVLFVPPDPVTFLSVNGGASFMGGPTHIYLKTKDGLASRSIRITSSGQIDF